MDRSGLFTIRNWCFFLSVVVCETTLAQSMPLSNIREYVDAIAGAQADLDAGRIADARQKLEATDKSMRSLEYEYLVARTSKAQDNEAAPDLLQMVKRPEVDTRYGVLDPVKRQVAFICRDGGVRVHDLDDLNGAPRTAMHETGGPIWTGAFSRDGATFVAGYQSGDVVAWDTTSWERRFSVSLGMKPVRELVVAPDGLAFVAEGESAMELWRVVDDAPKKVADVGERYNFGEGLAFSPRGDLIATGGMFDILVFDAKTGKETITMPHASYTMGLEFSPDGTRIASAPRANVNKFLAVFDVASGEMQFNAGPFPCYVHGGIFTADGKRIVSAACEKVPFLQLFDSTTGELVFSLPRTTTGSRPTVSRDGRILGWSESDGYHFFDLSGKQR